MRLDLAALAADTAKDLAKEQSLSLHVPPSITVLVDSILGAGSAVVFALGRYVDCEGNGGISKENDT